jgi:hypothetical protein
MYLSAYRAEKLKPLKEFEEFKCEDWEWDNIPKVIPHFSIYLQNCLKQVALVCTDYSDSGISIRLK